MKLTLIVLAAGMGTRFGGQKQLESFGPDGETLMEYAIHNAVRAGFKKVVFVIRKENLLLFKNRFDTPLSKHIEVHYAIQPDKVYLNHHTLLNRSKPWGTGHALLSARLFTQEPFAVINADDYYSPKAFMDTAHFLLNDLAENNYCLIGFPVKNTLSAHGTVSRACCAVNTENYLLHIHERKKLQFRKNKLTDQTDIGEVEVDESTLVSMNLWGFHPSIFSTLQHSFSAFLQSGSDLKHEEFFLSSFIQDQLMKHSLTIKVIPCYEAWMGITYQSDSLQVKDSIATLIQKGVYPTPLWTL